jgi:hydroxypyruvate reductase
MVEGGKAPETPKPGDPAFNHVDVDLVASNRLALEAVLRRAGSLGLVAQLVSSRLAGEAAPAGREVARTLLSYSNPVNPQSGGVHKNAVCLVWGGETTVTLGAEPPGKGGRNQEFALAAAEVLGLGAEGRGERGSVTLLAAGTDGRDGPTDAAGAIVDASTWLAIRQAGRDPARDLAGHDAYPALDSAGTLLKIGMTGTNVMDVVIGLVQNAEP